MNWIEQEREMSQWSEQFSDNMLRALRDKMPHDEKPVLNWRKHLVAIFVSMAMWTAIIYAVLYVKGWR